MGARGWNAGDGWRRKTAGALLHHPAVTTSISKQTAAFLRWFNALLLVSVMFVRAVVGSHSLFDSVGGLAFGIIIFWAAVIPLNALLAGASGLRLAKHFSFVWLAFALVMLFYSMNPYRWGLIALVIYIVLAGEVLFLRWRPKRSEENSQAYRSEAALDSTRLGEELRA